MMERYALHVVNAGTVSGWTGNLAARLFLKVLLKLTFVDGKFIRRCYRVSKLTTAEGTRAFARNFADG